MSEAKILACRCGNAWPTCRSSKRLDKIFYGIICKPCGATVPIEYEIMDEAIWAWNSTKAGDSQPRKTDKPPV